MNDEPSSRGGLTVRDSLGVMLGDTLIYGIVTVFVNSTRLFTMPLLTRHFSIFEYGIVDLLTMLTAALVACAVLGQDSSLVRFFLEMKSDKERRILITQSLTQQLSFSLFLIGVLWLLKSPLFALLALGNGMEEAIFPALISIPFYVVILNCQTVLRVSRKKNAFLLFSFFSIFLNFGWLTISIYFFNVNIAQLFWTYLSINVALSVIGLLMIRKWLARPRGIMTGKLQNLYAIPLGLIMLISACQPALERLMASYINDPHALGIYAVAVTIALFINFPISAFQTALSTFIMRIYKQTDFIDTLNMLLKIYVFAISASIVTMAVISEPLVFIFAGEQYHKSASLVFFITIGLALQSIGMFTGVGTILSGKTYYRLISYVACLVVVTSITLCFVAQYGVTAIALASLLGRLSMCLIESVISQRLWPLTWDYASIPFMLVPVTLFGLFLTNFRLSTQYVVFVYVAMIFALIALFIKSLKSNERILIAHGCQNFIKKIKKT
jgi:O-antigen/teichoic acid export membrane protein